MGSFIDFVNKKNGISNNNESTQKSSFDLFHEQRELERQKEEEERKRREAEEEKKRQEELEKKKSEVSSKSTELPKASERYSYRNKTNSLPTFNMINSDNLTDKKSVSIDEIKAMQEADKVNEEIKKGGAEKFNAIVGNTLNSFQGGVMRGTAGLANTVLLPTAQAMKHLDNDTKQVGIEDNIFGKVYDKILDASNYISDRAGQQDQVNSRIDNGFTRTIGSVGSQVGNMVPSMAANAVAPGSGLIVTGLSAGGNSAHETLNEDRSNIDKAIATGILKGAVEVGTEKIAGGNFLAKGSLDDVAGKIISSKVKSNVGKILANKGYSFLGEMAEEQISDNAGYIIDKVINNKDLPSFNEWWNNAGETNKSTFLTTLALDLLGFGGGNVSQEYENDQMQKMANEVIEAANNDPEIIQEIQQAQNNQNQQNSQLPIANQENSYSTQLKQTALDEINNSNVSETDKQSMIEALNNIDTLTNEDMASIRDTINALQENTTLETKGNFKEDAARRQKYVQYKNDNGTYDSTIVNEVLDTIPENRNGRRTVKQWLQAADEIGIRIADLSDAEIERIAYKSWFDIQPSKSITQYDSQAKQPVGFQKFTSDEWINTINNAVNEARANNQVQETQELPVVNEKNAVSTEIPTNLVESAKQYNLNYKNSNLSEIQKSLENKGIQTRFDETEFTNENEGAKWKLTRNEDGSVTREIVLNPKANEKTRIQEMAIHELTHDIVAKNTDTSTKLYKEVKQWLKNDSDYITQLESLKELYGEELAEEEAIAKTLQTKFGNQEEINRLVNYNPSMARRIYDWVVDKLNKITGGKIERLYWEDVRNKFEKAYSEEGNYSNKNSLEKYYFANVDYFDEMEYNNSTSERVDSKTWKAIDDSIGRENLKPGIYETEAFDYAEDQWKRYTIYYKNKGEYKIINSQNIDENNYTEGANSGINKYSKAISTSNDTTKSTTKYNSGNNGKTYNGGTTENISELSNQNEGYSNTNRENNSQINRNKQNIEDSDKSSFSMDNQGRTLTKEQQERYKDISTKLRDENGNIKRYYHGTQRGDRVGNIFDPNKATSGPMAFFTDNADIAKSYSENKQDTSLSRDYDSEYDLFKANNMKLDTYWRTLSESKRNEIRQKGFDAGLDEDYNVAFGKNLSKEAFGNEYEYLLKRNNNNAIKALYDIYVNSGNLWQEEIRQFKDVLDYVGVDNTSYLDPYKSDSKVYEVYLNIKNPFDTSNISKEILNKLEKVSKKVKYNAEEAYSADMWDKTNITPSDWIEYLKEDIENGTTHSWTRIPDWVTGVLKNEGYDGIVDTGGKHGGQSHQVVIPFYSEQIKNIDNTNPTDNPDIRYSNNANFDKYLENRIGKKGTRTTLGELRSTYNTAPTSDNVLATSEYTKKQNSVKEQEQIAKILDEPIIPEKEKSRAWAIAKANLIDKGIVFEELSRKTKNRELQGKWDYMLTSGARGQNAIGQARYDMDSKTKTQKQISKSLEDIRTEVGKNTSEFQNYMYHQLNIDRMTLQDRFGTENKPVFGDNISAEYSRRKVAEFEKNHPEFKEYAQDVYDFLDANKKELVERGVISQELSDKLKELYPHYVPIKRVDTKGLAIKVPLDTNRTGINSPLAKAKGGSSDIQPLFQTIADRTMQTYRASARNNFGVELMNTLNSITESNKTDVENILDQIGDEKTEFLKEGENGQNPTFTVFNNGEKTTFEITRDMYDALKPQSDIIRNINNSKFAKTLNNISNFRRGVLTEYNPIFSITNALKDAQDVVSNSQHAAKTYAKFPEAYSQIVQKGYWYNEYVQNGGEQNSYFRDGEFTSDKKESRLKTAAKVPFETISKINNVIEMAPRLAEYIASREAGRSVETSMLDAARVTTNFKAGGDITKTLNRNGATFLNASVQGFQQQIRNIQEAHAKGLKGYAVLAAKYAVLSLPSILLNGLIWNDDKDYEDLQDYVKDNYYIIAKYGDGKFIRIPKGRVAATVQKIIGNISEYVTDDKKELNIDNFAKDFWEDLKFAGDNVAPNNPLDNNVISPIIQAITNTSWYGEDIVPTRLQNKPDKEQYDETTDKLSIWLGQKLNQSPYKINYLLDQYGGGLADIILPTMTKQAENNVVEDKFTTDSVMKNKYPGEFYDQLDDLKIKANSIDSKDEDVLKYKYMSSVSGKMSNLYAEKREIQNSDLSDKDKKAKIKVVQEKINKIAEEAVNGVDSIKATSNTATINDTQYYKITNNGEAEWKKLSDNEKEKNKDISLKTYADYKNKTVGKKTDAEQIQALIKSSYTNKEKLAIYENYINSNDSKLSLVKDLNIDITDYLKYKTEAGSYKAEKADYIKNGSNNMSYMNKLILYGSEYVMTTEEKRLVANYITSLNKTSKQKIELLRQIKGITVNDDGSYYIK